MKKIFLITNGCPENQIDLSRMRTVLEANGWAAVDELRKADAVLFNACCLTQETEDNSFRIIEAVKKHKPLSANFIVCGCLTKLPSGRLQTVYKGPTFGSDDIQGLCDAFGIKEVDEKLAANSLAPRIDKEAELFPVWSRHRVSLLAREIRSFLFEGLLTAKVLKHMMIKWNKYNRATTACDKDCYPIKVCTGCRSACAYCSVRLCRGRLRSKSKACICDEFDEGLRKGYKKFFLIGTDVASYGLDQGETLVSLLEEMTKRKGDFEIKIRNIEPRILIKMLPELCEILKHKKISTICIPVESGNNRILGLMRRGHSIEDFKVAISVLHSRFPEIKIRSQVMVGFPTETNEEFMDTMNLIDQLPLHYVEVFRFQPRPGTEAVSIEPKVPQKIINQRYRKTLTKVFFHKPK